MKRRTIQILIFLLTLVLAAVSAQGQHSTVKKTLETYIHQNFDLPVDDLKMEFPHLNRKVADVTDSVKLLPATGALKKGYQFLKCGVVRDGRIVDKFSVRVNIRTFRDVVVSKASLSRHSVFEEEHLVIRRRETTRLRQKAYSTLDDILGLRSTRFVQSGEIITENLIEPTPVIARGSKVTMHFVKQTLEIVLPGVAREDGQVGEMIRVRCLETLKHFKAEVLDDSNVLVELL